MQNTPFCARTRQRAAPHRRASARVDPSRAWMVGDRASAAPRAMRLTRRGLLPRTPARAMSPREGRAGRTPRRRGPHAARRREDRHRAPRDASCARSCRALRHGPTEPARSSPIPRRHRCDGEDSPRPAPSAPAAARPPRGTARHDRGRREQTAIGDASGHDDDDRAAVGAAVPARQDGALGRRLRRCERTP